MFWIIGAIVVVFLYFFVAKPITRRQGIKLITSKVEGVTKKLRILAKRETTNETYQHWLEKPDPEELCVRVFAYGTGDKKLLGELAGKLMGGCEAIEKVLKLDSTVNSLIEAGAINGNNFSYLEEAKIERRNLVALADQFFDDIKKKLAKS